MSALSIQEKNVDSLIEEVKHHRGYRPEINNEVQAIQALRGLPPYTYLIRKAEKHLEYYVSYVEADYQVISQRFIIDKNKLLFQYWQGGSGLGNGPLMNGNSIDGTFKCKDPYYLNFYEDLNDVIFIASMKSPDMNKVQTLV